MELNFIVINSVKGVTLTHGNLIAHVAGLSVKANFYTSDV